MKPGDKVKCKRNYELNEHYFYKDKVYIIRLSPRDYVNQLTGKYYKLTYIDGINFFLDKTEVPEHSIASPYFYDYFYDIKEERKQKLKKIYKAL